MMPVAVDNTVTGAAAPHLPRIVVTEDGRRMRLVDEETLRYFLTLPLRPPMRCAYSAEVMRTMGLNDREVDSLLRASHNAQKAHDIHVDVLQQYNARGYAYLEVPELYPDNDDMDEQTVELY
ncbi:unnamed protein product [Alopecurus aequalis]